MFAVSMKLTPRSRARLMIANEVCSSAPTLCMNDFSSASPNVIAPRQSTGTLSPLFPSDRYSMSSCLLLRGRGRLLHLGGDGLDRLGALLGFGLLFGVYEHR